MSQELPFEFSHEVEDGVLVQDITGWDGNPDHTEPFESEWKQRAKAPEIVGAVTLFGDDIDLGKETQDHFAEVWGPAADGADIDRLAFVSSGIKARAISAKVNSAEVDIKVFNDQDEAFEWARGG